MDRSGSQRFLTDLQSYRYFAFLNSKQGFPMKNIWYRNVFGLFLFAATALAQFDSAVVLGTVSDQAGGVVEGAKVSLLNNQTGVVQTANTDSSGSYQFLNV